MRKILLITGIILTFTSCAWGEETQISSPAPQNSSERIKLADGLELYEACKAGLSVADFSATPCGMYLQGFYVSYATTNIYLMSMRNETKESKSLNTITAEFQKCPQSKTSLQDVARSYIEFIETQLKNDPDLKIQGIDVGGFFWDRFLGCGKQSILTK